VSDSETALAALMEPLVVLTSPAHQPVRCVDLGSQAEQPRAERIEDVIIDHGAAPPAHRRVS
jgi:hypothetical protein